MDSTSDSTDTIAGNFSLVIHLWILSITLIDLVVRYDNIEYDDTHLYRLQYSVGSNHVFSQTSSC